MAEAKKTSSKVSKTQSESKLNSKLATIYSEVGALKKKKGKQYDFVSSDIVLHELRGLIIKQNLLLIPNVKDTKARVLRKGTGRDEQLIMFTELFMTYTWKDVESGDSLTVDWYGQGVEYTGEKGVGKALTYAEKYFLLKFFNIPTDSDDPDANQRAPRSSSSSSSDKTDDGLNRKKGTVSEKQLNLVHKLIDEKKVEKEKLKKHLNEKGWGIESFSDMSMSQASSLIDSLMKRATPKDDLPSVDADTGEEINDDEMVDDGKTVEDEY